MRFRSILRLENKQWISRPGDSIIPSWLQTGDKRKFIRENGCGTGEGDIDRRQIIRTP
jgi:hypothetical protein